MPISGDVPLLFRLQSGVMTSTALSHVSPLVSRVSLLVSLCLLGSAADLRRFFFLFIDQEVREALPGSE